MNRKARPEVATKAIVGEKVGMTQVWSDDNRVVPVTMVRVAPLRVVQVKTTERDGYSAVQVTFGRANPRRLNKPEAGHFDKAGVEELPSEKQALYNYQRKSEVLVKPLTS